GRVVGVTDDEDPMVEAAKADGEGSRMATDGASPLAGVATLRTAASIFASPNVNRDRSSASPLDTALAGAMGQRRRLAAVVYDGVLQPVNDHLRGGARCDCLCFGPL